MATGTKIAKRGRGRPRTEVEWVGIGVRFTAAEKTRLARIARLNKKSQAEYIRRSTILQMDTEHPQATSR